MRKTRKNSRKQDKFCAGVIGRTGGETLANKLLNGKEKLKYSAKTIKRCSTRLRKLGHGSLVDTVGWIAGTKFK